MIIPISDPAPNNFYGADIWSVTPTSLNFVGSVDHGRSIERSAYVGDNIYTKSLCKIIITDPVDPFDTLGEISLPC